MIIPPPEQLAPAVMQRSANPTDLRELGREDIASSFRAVRLRHHIDASIAKNEQLGTTASVVISDLQSGQLITDHNEDTEQFAASLNKIPIAQLILKDVRKGTLRFDTQLTWANEDVRAGEGVFDKPEAPLKATVRDLLFDMLNPSGNTATRVLVNQGLGGATMVNERMDRDLRLTHTRLQPLDNSSRFYMGNTTARESLQSLQDLVTKRDEYSSFARAALARNIYTGYGVRDALAGNDYIVLANKVGILDDPEGDNRHDTGIIYNTRTHKSYGYAFMHTSANETYDGATALAQESLRDMGAALLRFTGDKPR